MIIKRIGIKINDRKVFDKEIKEDKLNVIHGPDKVGKSLIYKLTASAFGDLDSWDGLFGENGIENITEIRVAFKINEYSFEVELVVFPKNKDAKSFTVYHNNEKNNFSSSEDMSEFIFEKIGYPRYVTWDYNTRKTMIFDLLIPLFYEQTKTHSLYNGSIHYKHANRTALAIAFLSNQYKEEIKYIFSKNSLLERELKKDTKSKRNLISFINESKNRDEDIDFEAFNEYHNMIEEYEALLSKTRNINKANVGTYNANLLIFDAIVAPRLIELEYNEEQVKQVKKVYENVWFSGIEIITPEKAEIKKKTRELKKEIDKFEKSDKYSNSFYMSEKFINKIERSIGEYSEETKTNDIEKVTNLWKDLFYKIRKKFDSFALNDDSDTNIAFKLDNSSSGNNLNDKYIDIYKGFKETFGINHFFVDSPLESDDGIEGKQKRFDALLENNILGIMCITSELNFESEKVNLIKLEKDWMDK